MAYSVKSPDVESVRDVLVRLWKSNLPVGVDAYAKFDWSYRKNPLGPGSAVLLETDVGGADGKSAEYVGCAGVGMRRFFMGGELVKTALLADLAVEKKHRTVMPALVLTKGVRALCEREFQLVYGFPNKHAEGLFTRLGYVQLGRMTRYALVLRHAQYAARKIPNPLLAAAAGWIADLPYRAAWQHGIAARRTSFALEFIEAFDPRFDDLWQRAKASYPLLGYRGADFLNWRFRESVGFEYQIVALRDADGTKLRAYAVLELDKGTVIHLADVLGETDRHVELLLTMVASTYRSRGFASISVRYLGHPRFVELLGRLGFREREATRMVIADASGDLASSRDFIADAKNWYILDGDEDS